MGKNQERQTREREREGESVEVLVRGAEGGKDGGR